MFQCWAELFFGAAEDLFGGGHKGLENQQVRTMWRVRTGRITSVTRDESGHALWHDQGAVTEKANRNERWAELGHTRWYDRWRDGRFWTGNERMGHVR